jgi:membrane protein
MFRKFTGLLVEAFGVWNAINAGRLASSIAFFALLSLAPMLVLVATIASRLLSIQGQSVLTNLLQGLLGSEAEVMATRILDAFHPSNGSLLASVIALVTFLWSATTLFSLLKLALDEIWDVPSSQKGLFKLIRRKLTALVVVIGMALLLTLVLGLSTAANRATVESEQLTVQATTTFADLVVSFLMLSLIVALMLKYIPDFRLGWRDVFSGGMVTALLILILKAPLQFYLNRMAANSPFSGAGTVVILVFFTYVIALVFFYGASFTRVYSARYGSLKKSATTVPPA